MPYIDIHTHRPTGRHIEPSSAGIHPWDASEANADTDLFTASAADAQAIGETGLDFIRGGDRKRQEDIFTMQLDIASKLGKPVILHCVKAFEPMMRILARYRLPAVIFHGFTGSPQQALRAVEKGYFLSFGERTFRSPKASESLRMTPDENLFLETDDAQTNIEEIYDKAAAIRNTTSAELQNAIFENYKRIFCKP